MKSLAGNLLAASPYVDDQNFARAVVLVLRHDEQGAVGLILNRPLKQQVKPIWERLSGEPFPTDLSISYGGPCPGPLLAIHRSKRLSEYEFSAGVYLAAERMHLEQLMQNSKDPFRLFLGHAGWEPGQLEYEMKIGDWLVMPALPQHVFNDDEELWRKVVRHVGDTVLRLAPGVKYVPADPSLN